MKRKLITRMLVLTLAISGLFVIGNNVYSNQLLEVNICQACGYNPVPPETQCPVCGWSNDGGGVTYIWKDCWGRGGGLGIGYYYCNSYGVECDWVHGTDPDYETPKWRCYIILNN